MGPFIPAKLGPDKTKLTEGHAATCKCPNCCAKVRATDVQVGGEHYQLPIQPITYITKNKLGFCEGNIVKYISRYKQKNGKEDLEKIKHYVDLLIEAEYG